jgi:hypothetical protein
LSAYVRKTAVIGILKLRYLSPSLIETNGYMTKLYQLLLTLINPPNNLLCHPTFNVSLCYHNMCLLFLGRDQIEDYYHAPPECSPCQWRVTNLFGVHPQAKVVPGQQFEPVI